ncbi:hypothetical protein PRZ48_001376 [Zasmidium cellare]|uniref:Alcohol oxidase n=1 Tax=Zasmidium cellare TaxID=395010 RepID=A0ABR0F2N0_ZASCE|nr:hypothetical protein PRZ48_001376 [Zasmidium cellare]
MGSTGEGKDEFDIIIVGAGTSGCVLVNRLSEDPNVSILLIEAGEDRSTDENVYTPGLCTSLLGNDQYDWRYTSEVEPGINGRQILHPRGKIIGGTSSINSFALIYPSAAAMDAWAELGNKGWDWKTIGPYFKKFQTIYPPTPEVKKDLNVAHSDENIAASNGPLKAAFPPSVRPLQKAWVDTFRTLGLENRSDPLDGHALGGHTSTCHISGDRYERSHAGVAFFDPVRERKNVHLVSGALVRKVELEEQEDGLLRATGVLYSKSGAEFQVKAKKEVILASGVFNTPQLLELSGIGNPDILQKHGIEVKHANVNVGENLQDHIKAAISFEAIDGIEPTVEVPSSEMRAQYEKDRTGPWAWTAHSFAYLPLPPFLDTAGKEELNILISQHPPTSSSTFAKAHHAFITKTTLSPDQATVTAFQTGRPAAPVTSGRFISLCAMLSYPLSTGSSHIQSSDPTTKPKIHFNYYTHPLDLEIHARHVQSLHKLSRTQPLASFIKPGGRTLPPGLDASNLDDAKEICRGFSTTNYHPCGTAAMLPEAVGGVVDERLRVYGTGNLRVVDGSVVPVEPRGNLITVVYAVAERGADIIKEDLGLKGAS